MSCAESPLTLTQHQQLAGVSSTPWISAESCYSNALRNWLSCCSRSRRVLCHERTSDERSDSTSKVLHQKERRLQHRIADRGLQCCRWSWRIEIASRKWERKENACEIWSGLDPSSLVCCCLNFCFPVLGLGLSWGKYSTWWMKAIYNPLGALMVQYNGRLLDSILLGNSIFHFSISI